jgi:hypothetical protein
MLPSRMIFFSALGLGEKINAALAALGLALGKYLRKKKLKLVLNLHFLRVQIDFKSSGA